MGFRDLELFNQAMLAKQGWRLMSNPDSLCAKVLRGKYFHGSSFIEAKRKRNASHSWNAMLHGREALKLGLIKRIGDGSSVRIWEDPWIPSNFSKKPLVKLPEVEVSRVQQLIDDELNCWDSEKIN